MLEARIRRLRRAAASTPVTLPAFCSNQVGHRVRRCTGRAVPVPNLQMEVIAEAGSRAAQLAHPLARLHLLAELHVRGRAHVEVEERALDRRAVEGNVVAPSTAVALLDHG